LFARTCGSIEPPCSSRFGFWREFAPVILSPA
jgi:hypothetical protein